MLDTVPAAVAIVCNLQSLLLSSIILLLSVEKTGMTRHHDRRSAGAAVFDRLFYQGDKFLHIVGIGNTAEFHAASLNQGFYIHTSGSVQCCRCRLIPCHGGGSVVEDDQHKSDILGHRSDQCRDAGMKKGGIANGRHDVEWFLQMLVGMVKTCRLTDGGPHTQHGMDRTQIQTQRITADIAGVDTPGSRFLNGKKLARCGQAAHKVGLRPGAAGGAALGSGNPIY